MFNSGNVKINTQIYTFVYKDVYRICMYVCMYNLIIANISKQHSIYKHMNVPMCVAIRLFFLTNLVEDITTTKEEKLVSLINSISIYV